MFEVPVASDLSPQVQANEKARELQQLEWDILFQLEEATALMRAEIVLHNELNDPYRSAEDRAKRAPFLSLAMKMTQAQRQKRWKNLTEMFNKWIQL